MSWKKKTRRILYVVIALFIGFGIIYFFSLAGSKMKGPIENILNQTSEVVHNVEEQTILQKKENKRAVRLSWLNNIRNNTDSIKNTKYFLLGGSDNHSKESYESIINLEDSLHTVFPLIHIYTAWGSKDEEQFPKLEVETINELGSIPVITWEPWLSDFNDKEIRGIPKPEARDKGCLAEIAKGIYDSYIIKWATEAKKIEKPFFLRVGHEMNDPYRYPWGPQNNKPEDYINAWRHIHNIFKNVGAKNVLWIWSPHLSYGYLDAFYPGKNYVDFIGIGVLNYGTAVYWSKWWTFEEIFGNHYLEIKKYNKPIMITEFGSLKFGGNRSKWFNDAFNAINTKYPLVKSLVFFHYNFDNTLTDKAISWYLLDDKPVLNVVRGKLENWNY